MQPAQAFSPNATTFLTHLVGLGLADTRYVVQRFKSMLDGDIRPVESQAPKGSRRRTAKRVLATLKEVKDMRPGRNEIIVCTGLSIPQLRGPVLGRPRNGALPRPPPEGLTARTRTPSAGRPIVGRAPFERFPPPARRRPMCEQDIARRGAPATWSGITGAPPSAGLRACA